MELHSRPIRLASYGTVVCEPEWRWAPQPQYFRDFDLWFIWAGRGTMTTPYQTIDLFPGVIFCLRPHTIHSATHDPKQRLGVSYLHFDFLDDGGQPCVPDGAALPPHHCVLSEVALYDRLLRMAVEDAQSGIPARVGRAEQAVRMVLSSMKIEASASGVRPREQEYRRAVEEVMRQVRQNPGKMIGVDEMAECAGYGVDHFGRIFKDVAGVSPKEFSIRVRMERAMLLLRGSAMGIEEISRSLGYADVFFFSRQFKQRIGTPPSLWRERVGGTTAMIDS